MTRNEVLNSIANKFHEACDMFSSALDKDAMRLSMLVARMHRAMRINSDNDQHMTIHDCIDEIEDIAVSLHSNSDAKIDVPEHRKAIVALATTYIDHVLANLDYTSKKLAAAESALKSKDFDIQCLKMQAQGATEARTAAHKRLSELTERTSIHPETRERVLAATGGRCYYCDVELVRCAVELQPNDTRRVYHIDHLVPKSVGGSDHICNYVPSCGPCNTSKSDKPYIEFVRDKHPRLKLVVSA